MTWHVRPLGEVAKIGAGNSAPQGDKFFSSDGVPFFRTSDVGRVRFGKIGESADRLNEEGSRGLRPFPKGTILFPKSGASTFLNHRVMLDVGGFVSSHLATIIADESRIRANYLLYFLATVKAQDLVQDHAYPSLNLPAIAGIQVPTPPLEEQNRIVALLDEAFAGIATAKANAEKNLQRARTVFEGILRTVFEAADEHSRVDELFDVASSRRVLKSEWKSDGVPFYRGREVTRLALEGSVDNELFISEDHFADLAAKNGVPTAGDILITAIGTIGNAHIVRENDRFYFKDASVLWMRRTSDVSSEYVKYWIRSAAFHNQLDRGNGATVDTLTIGKLESLMIPSRSVGAQKAAVEKLARVEQEIVKLESLYTRKVAALDELKQSLLHQAFSGQL